MAKRILFFCAALIGMIMPIVASAGSASIDDDKVLQFSVVEQRPSFPGGDAAMYQWLSQNMVYPAAAAEEGASGRVVVEFVVEKDGSISNVRVIRSRHPALDREAVRVVSAMPRWIPGQNYGQTVRVFYMLPLTFRLTETASPAKEPSDTLK